MRNIDKETEIIAVEKVLEEMKSVEEYVRGWNACWWEQFLDAYCPNLHYGIGKSYVRDLERKYEPRYVLSNAFYSGSSIGVPLAIETLTMDDEEYVHEFGREEYVCEFGRIDWFGMKSNNSSRQFSFRNNGDIEFSKYSNKRQNLNHPERIDYKVSFNVLKNDFSISVTIDKLNEDYRYWKKEHKYDYITMSLNENTLIESFNDIKIIHDLNTGIKQIIIEKKYDKNNKKSNADVEFTATLDNDEKLKKGTISINTHKGNGKINGSYRFDVSASSGIRANFYSRKGVKFDLTKNIVLLETASNLMITSSSKITDNEITKDFAENTKNVINNKNRHQKIISFDNSDFNMNKVKETERKIMEIVKSIKGELPLRGIVDRINNCLELIENKTTEVLDVDDYKILTLSKK